MVFGRKSGNERRRAQLMDGQDDTTFRRSRTMQGSTSSNVKSANQKKTVLKSDRLKKQQQDRRKRIIFILLSIVLITIIGVWYLISQYAVGVGSISFQPATDKAPPSELYKKAIVDYMSVRPAERFRFALSQERLSQAVSNQLPEVKKIYKNGADSNNINFKIELRKPIASWKTSNKQSFVDEEGVSFTHNYFSDPGVSISDNSGAAANSKNDTKAVVSERFLRFLGRLIALTNTSGLGEVKEASIPRATTREIDIKLEGRPYLVKTHIDRDPAATVEDIKRVVGFVEQKKVTPSYIDVRVTGRAFYK